MPNSIFTTVPTYLERMISQTQQNGGQITDFHIGSVARSLFESLAAALSYQSLVADQLQLDGYLDTATGQALDDLAGNFKIARLPAIQASGQVQITRQDTSLALSIPAGWGQLSTVPIPGIDSVAVITTEDATFGVGVAVVTVNAIAIVGGATGNLGQNITLLPTSPINGVESNGGYATATIWSGGVDVESDAAFRARIPLAIQGQVKGKEVSFQAAVLGVPGVQGVGVRQAGDTLGDASTVPPGSVNIYYRGSAGLLGAVQSAVDDASVLNQNAVAYASVSLQLGFTLPATFPATDGLVFADRGQMETTVGVTVYVNPGVDTSATAVAVTAALMGFVNGLTIGQVAHYSQAINILHEVPEVISVGVPFADFRLRSTALGTATDITPLVDSYLNLAASNVTVAIAVLT